MPGTQAQSVNKNTIKIEPQPLSMTAKGGNKIAKITLSNDMIIFFYACKYNEEIALPHPLIETFCVCLLKMEWSWRRM